MTIYPAIDIRDGKCVRLYKGDFSKETVFSEDPADMALKWEDMGATYLHLVDLDGARAGHPCNLDTVKAILDKISIPAELGGGIRDIDSIAQILDLGIERVILGSAAARDPELVRHACKRFGGDHIVAGIDAKDGIVAVDGWEKSGNMPALELAKKMGGCGVKTIIYTDISRDGTLSGVNVEATSMLAKGSGVSIVASGGVSSLDDIKKIKVAEQDGIEGVIVGRSIYTGTLDLSEALKIANQ